jgi:hypothetical protein
MPPRICGTDSALAYRRTLGVGTSMPQTEYTNAQDKALFAQILQLPVQRIAAAILFILIRRDPHRVAIVQYLTGL